MTITAVPVGTNSYQLVNGTMAGSSFGIPFNGTLAGTGVLACASLSNPSQISGSYNYSGQTYSYSGQATGSFDSPSNSFSGTWAVVESNPAYGGNGTWSATWSSP